MKCRSNKTTNDNTRTLSVLIAIGLTLLVIPAVLVFLDPQHLIINFITRITVGSNFYEILARENALSFVKVYVFNVTNAEAFQSGDDHKLRLEEVGPFTYREYRINDKFEVDEEAEVMRYIPRIRTEFQRELSIDDPERVNVTVPNAAMLAISSMFSSYPFWTKAGFTVLADRLHSKPIININVHDLLWGYDEPLIALSNTLMPGWITFSKMGILDRLYDQSSLPVLEVSTAVFDKFKVKKTDGYPGLKVWEHGDFRNRTRCNTFVDTYEGYAFTPGFARNASLRLYRNTFCRMLDLGYVGTTTTDVTSEAFVYQISNKSYSIDPNTECLCGDINECIDGISDISPCLYGLNIALSNGHFLYANPKVYERIEGMRPNEKEHGSEFIIEPITGVVLGARLTLQVNVNVKDVDFYPRIRPFSKMVVPLAYFKIVQPELPEEDKRHLRQSTYLLPYTVLVVEVVVFIIGLTILAYALRQMYLQQLCSGSHKNNEERSGNLQVSTPLIHEKLPTFDSKSAGDI